MTIIIKTPQPDVEERLVLVPIADTTRERQAADPTAWRDATPEDLERAGLVLREQAAPGTLAHLRADLRDMTARAEKAELDAAEWAAEVDALRAEALAELADARRERDTLLAELADAKAECQGAMLSAYAQYAETVRERDEAREAMASVVGQLRGRDEETQRLAGTLRERNEAKELARVLEVERDTLHAELADAKAERDRAIRDCAATAAERNEARAEVARLAAPAEGEPSFEHLRDCWDMAPRADASGSDVFRNGFFALYRLGVAHERARQQPAPTFVQATGTHTYGGRPRAGQGLPPDAQPDADRATDEERCLVTRAVGMLADVSLARHPQRGLGERTYTIRVQCPAEPNAIAAAVPASDVPATLARLLGEVSR